MKRKAVILLNKDEFTQKVLACERTLYRVAKSICIRNVDCEDAVQEAILKAYEKRNTLREECFFKTWLIRILINQCYHQMRSVKKTVSYEEYMKENQVEETTRYPELYQAILNLPEKMRVTIVLHYVEGYSVQEVSRILKIPSGTVKSRLSKGRTLLQKQLEVKEVEYE